jgi:hypothetical protein
MLGRMLVEAIDICAAWTVKGASGVGVDDAAWAEACWPTVAADGRRQLEEVWTEHRSRGHEPRQTQPTGPD